MKGFCTLYSQFGFDLYGITALVCFGLLQGSFGHVLFCQAEDVAVLRDELRPNSELRASLLRAARTEILVNKRYCRMKLRTSKLGSACHMNAGRISQT